MIASFRRTRFGKEVSEEEIPLLPWPNRELAAILEPVARALSVDPARKPFVVLVVGVNGAGKTTTIGKLAHPFIATRTTRGAGRGRYFPCSGG